MTESDDNTGLDPIDDLFGEPALINGEDKERYMRLRAAVEADLKPKTIFDWMRVKDVTDKYWEELRLRHSGAALIDGAFKEAFDFYVNQVAKLADRIPLAITREYYSGDEEAKKEVVSFLEMYSVTMDQIQAKAIQIVGGTLNMLDRMIANRETARRILRKENERQLAATEKALPAEAQEVPS
jgi:hypothetical protein